MRTLLDFTPYRRSLIGFDRVFDMLENATTFDTSAYPPYDVEQEGEDTFRVRVAVAGYTAADIDATVHQNVLVVRGRSPEKAENRKFLHRGITAGEFELRFQLAEHVEVTRANLSDGMLEIELKREVPEAAKPRKIAIGETPEPKRLTSAKAA